MFVGQRSLSCVSMTVLGEEELEELGPIIRSTE